MSKLTFERIGTRQHRGPSRSTLGSGWKLTLFFVPAVLVYGFLVIYPTLRAFQYSVTNWNGYSSNYNYIGFTNFRLLFTEDGLFSNALSNSLKLMIAVVIVETIVAFGLAVLLSNNIRSSRIVRSIIFFPAILSAVSVAFAFTFVYAPDGGLLNTFFQDIGLTFVHLDPLGSTHYGIYWVAGVQAWQYVGEMVLLFVAGLQQIPLELYEAASIDGATRFRQLRHVTRPLMMPTVILVATFTMIQAFQAFQLVYGLSGDPPASNVDILSTRILTTFADSQLGYAAAESIIFMLIIGTIAVIQRRLLRGKRGVS